MSYILDALRRAEAERGRGAVPGLHTPGTPAAGLPDGSAPGRAPMAVAVALAALAAAALAAGGMWWWQQRPASTPAVPAPLPAPAAAPAVQAPLPVMPAPAPAPRVERAAPTPPSVSPPPPSARRSPAPDAAPARPVPAPAPAPAAAPSAAPGAARPGAPAGTVFAPADLPASVREQLPMLQIAGVTYSSNPLYRMAIVNGQVLHEGDAAAPGLTLERVEPGRTVWAFQGYRYAVPSK